MADSHRGRHMVGLGVLAAWVVACSATGDLAAGPHRSSTRGGPTVVRAPSPCRGSSWHVRLNGGIRLDASGGSHQPTRLRVCGPAWSVACRDGHWSGQIGFHAWPRRDRGRWGCASCAPCTATIHAGCDRWYQPWPEGCEAVEVYRAPVFRSAVARWDDGGGLAAGVGGQSAAAGNGPGSPLTASDRAVILGDEAFEQGRFVDAAIRYGEAVLADRQNAEAMVGFGRALVVLGRFAEAARALRQLVRQYPAWVNVDLRWRGGVSDLRQAVGRLKAYAARRDGDRESRFVLGFARAFVGELEAAVGEMSALAGERPPDAEAAAVVEALRRRLPARTVRSGGEGGSARPGGRPGAVAPGTGATGSGGDP